MTKSFKLYLASSVVILGCGVALARQQDVEPSAHPAPTLERINHETQALYESVRPGLVRVTLPVPKWMEQLGAADSPLNKLDPKVRDKLDGNTGQMSTVITP